MLSYPYILAISSIRSISRATSNRLNSGTSKINLSDSLSVNLNSIFSSNPVISSSFSSVPSTSFVFDTLTGTFTISNFSG
ncbi:MAG: hypothetical protein R3A12_15965 [Ignavibacteria bacterium]